MKSALYFGISLLCLLSFSTSQAQSYCNINNYLGIDHNLGDDVPSEVLIQSDGKVIIAGTTYNNTTNAFRITLARLNENMQSLDDGFGSSGKLNHTWSGRNTCVTAALQSDEKILVGGYEAPGNGVSTFRPYIARINNDGTIDETFGNAGSKTFGSISLIDGRGIVVGIKELENGKIRAIFTGGEPAEVGAIQFNADGSIDENFGNDGMVSHAVSGMNWQTDYGDGVFTDDGDMFVLCKVFAGYTKPCVVKMNPDGSLDLDFGENGVLVIDYDIQYNFAGIYGHMHFDNQLLLSATKSNAAPHQYFVMKINAETGEFVTDFGSEGSGIVESSESNSFIAARQVVVDADENIVVIGTGGTTSNNATWMIDADGMEMNNCSGQNGYYEPVQQFHNGYYAGAYRGSDLVVASRGPVEQVGAGNNQGQNIVIPWEIPVVSVEETQSKPFLLFPNPSNQFVHIQTDMDFDSIILFNGQGQQVLNANGNDNSLDVSQLPPGCYFLRLIAGKQAYSETLIVR